MSQSFKYTSWVQLRIVKTDYINAKKEAAERLLSKAIQEKDEEAKQKALELLEELGEEL